MKRRDFVITGVTTGERFHWRVLGAKIVRKPDSLFMSVVFGILSAIVYVFTFGRGQTNWDEYATTIGRTIYVPYDWDEWPSEEQYRLLRHERVHLHQFCEWPFKFLQDTWAWRINAVIVGFCYLFVLPALWTMRAKFEREAYTESLLAAYAGGKFSDQYKLRKAERLANTFGGSAYFFMWRKGPAKKWALETMRKIEAGEIK